MFVYAKTSKTSGEIGSACVYFNGQRPALSPAKRAVTVGRQWIAITCTAATAVCACLRACVRVVFAMYDNNIWPRLIMIIIKIIILYIIQISHTDEFPSTGTRLVMNTYRNHHVLFCMVLHISSCMLVSDIVAAPMRPVFPSAFATVSSGDHIFFQTLPGTRFWLFFQLYMLNIALSFLRHVHQFGFHICYNQVTIGAYVCTQRECRQVIY